MDERNRVAWIYLLGFALDLVNMFAANVAMPRIGHDLAASVTQLSWVSGIYTLGLTVVIPAGPRLAAWLGEKPLICLSLAGFAVMSALAGATSDIHTLIGWRFGQGLFGGMLIPVGQAWAYRLTPATERSALTTRVMFVALLIPALSPMLGGVLVDAVSWRWLYLANVPLALMTLALAVLWLPRGQHVAASASFLPAIPSLLRLRALHTAMLVYLFVPGVFVGVNLIAALHLASLGYSPGGIGALMLPWAIASGVAILTTRRSFGRFGARPLLLVGMVTQALGILALGRVTAPGDPWAAGAFVLMGLGGSLCSSAAQTLAFTGVADARMGQASALWNMNRQLAFCAGPVVMGAVWQWLGGSYAFAVAALLTLLPATLALGLSHRHTFPIEETSA